MGKPQRQAVSYFRFSSKRQEAGSTIARQEKLLADYLEHNPDITLLEHFSDKGVSGFRGKHAREGALSRLIDAVKTGRLSTPLVLIVESIDRLGRDLPLDAFGRFNDLIKAGVTVAVCDMRLELDRDSLNRESWKLHSVLNSMERAHDESRRKSNMVTLAWNFRIKQAQTNKVAIKGYVGPPWVVLDETTQRYVEDPAPAETVRLIFQWAADGVSAHGIIKRLNEQNVPVFRAHTGKSQVRQGWYQGYISTLIQNRQVLGEHRYRDGDVIEGYFPAIVTPELFCRANQALTRRETKPGRKGNTLSNLFTGLARCAHCGGHMEMTRNRKATEDGPEPIKYLFCSNKKRARCDAVGMVSYPKVEQAILDFLPKVPWSDIIREESPNDPLPAIDNAIAKLILEIAEFIATRDGAKRMLVKGAAFEEEFEPMFLEAKAGLKDAEMRLATLQVERAKVAHEWGNRPGLVKNAIGYRDAMANASEAERLIIRTRLSEALKEMVTSMACDTVKKTVILTCGDRWELRIATPIRREPTVTHQWTITFPPSNSLDPAFIDAMQRTAPFVPADTITVTRIR